MFGTQTAEILSVFRRTVPDNPNIQNPRIDPSQITPTFPVDPAWLNLEPVAVTSTTHDCNGATTTFTDAEPDEWVTEVPSNWLTDLKVHQVQRMYQIAFRFSGTGTVDPIPCRLGWRFPGIETFELTRWSMPNPGNLTIGWVYVPAGVELQIQTTSNGGTGDNYTVHLTGVMAERGVPLPTLPSFTFTTLNAL